MTREEILEADPQIGDTVVVRATITGLPGASGGGGGLPTFTSTLRTEFTHFLNDKFVSAIEKRQPKIGDKVKSASAGQFVSTLIGIDGDRAWIRLDASDSRYEVSLKGLRFADV